MNELFPDESFNEISREYTEFMVGGFDCTVRNHAKAIGQFLTPSEIYAPMIEGVVEYLAPNTELSVVDPFCGDGRLLCALLSSIDDAFPVIKKVKVCAWDIDSRIIVKARTELERLILDLPFEVELYVENRDAFACSDEEYGTFSVCVTNPPWSSAKSLKKDSFSNAKEYDRYQKVASAYASRLVRKLPEAKGKSFGLGAINLSRFGMALSLRLIEEGGCCGIVMPSSFLADTGSALLRKKAFENNALRQVDYFPAEMRLFNEADQAGVALVLHAEAVQGSGTVNSHMPEGVLTYDTDASFWQYSTLNAYAIPVGYSADQVNLMIKLFHNPTLDECHDIHLGREVDETRINERLCERSPYRFVKGFMVHGYGVSEKDKWYYDSARIPIPKSADTEKVVWRDVSRVSQRKRVQGTLLPSGHVAGNSLGVATCNDSKKLRAFLGVLNSSTFEFMARSVLTTNHVSVGTLRRVPYPHMTDSQVDAIAGAVDELLQTPSKVSVYRKIDDLVAECYGLTKEEHKMVEPLGFWSDCPKEMVEALDDC
ncbi:N-6 DNA methylase [Olegusella massiliensis]|uniref:N-6 DNA methylase n=1 Tax=Olegusella massiliensis TaxID=1776381 RepID=UPI004055985A